MELVGNYRCNWNKPGICVHWRITKFPRFSLRHITSNDVIRPTKRITDASIVKRQQRYPELLLQRLLCHCCNRHQADVVEVLFSYEHLRTMGFFPECPASESHINSPLQPKMDEDLWGDPTNSVKRSQQATGPNKLRGKLMIMTHDLDL